MYIETTIDVFHRREARLVWNRQLSASTCVFSLRISILLLVLKYHLSNLIVCGRAR